MDIRITVKVPKYPTRKLVVLVKPAAWVAKGVVLDRKGYEAAAWFLPSSGKILVGTIALSKIDLNLVAHECCHAAWHLAAPDEERVCQLAGDLTARVWLKLQEFI